MYTGLLSGCVSCLSRIDAGRGREEQFFYRLNLLFISTTRIDEDGQSDLYYSIKTRHGKIFMSKDVKNFFLSPVS